MWYLSQLARAKMTTSTICNGRNHHVCREYLCQQLREKHHHHKLLPVTTTASTRCKGHGARCKGQDQHQRKSEWDSATTWNSNHHYRPAQDQHGRWWSAQCSNHCNLYKGRAWKEFELCALMQVAMIAALCTPPTPVLILSWSVVLVVGVICCCCIPLRLALMLVLTFAPSTLTLHTISHRHAVLWIR